MTKSLGESGRYVSDEAMRRKDRLILFTFIVTIVCGYVGGLLVSRHLPSSWLAGLGISIRLSVLCCSVPVLAVLVLRKLKALSR